jgi:hypothetical protein
MPNTKIQNEVGAAHSGRPFGEPTAGLPYEIFRDSEIDPEFISGQGSE